MYRIEEISDKDSLYPKRLLEIRNHPEKLYVMGNKELLNRPSIAIVGSRDIDFYGKEQTIRFSKYLSEIGYTIVSGLARGTDTYAHLASLDSLGKTIAVLPCGLNNIYPKENKMLVDSILENGGLIVSEYEPDREISIYRFVERNRIISGITLGTLVIEARYKSGSMYTANYALKQNRDLFVLPGDIGKERSYGTNKLILDGAELVTSPKDIAQFYEMWEEKEVKELKENKPSVNDDFKNVYDLILDIPISFDEIIELTKIGRERLSEILLMLELDGFIKKERSKKYVRL